ncbi:hypothetical protein GIB67_021044 [Kingdonia uniflora]|uniref:Uncharacterized protein n=1 Tax=Kingdonia uniflora TaxID=39325 RepID=A0A7J7N6X3_9MAGN|nr:hypothetical protein GIB67_021044 [Kingdonia uniflora]
MFFYFTCVSVVSHEFLLFIHFYSFIFIHLQLYIMHPYHWHPHLIFLYQVLVFYFMWFGWLCGF